MARLRQMGRRVHAVRGIPEAMEYLERTATEALLLDLGPAGETHLDSLRQLRSRWPSLAILVMVPRHSAAQAALALRLGADDYLLDPFDAAEFLIRLERILEHRDLHRKVAVLESDRDRRREGDPFIARSGVMQRLMQRLELVAPTRSTVQIRGESGVGKELVARAIHYRSPRRHRPYVTLNCSAIPETLIETELFGHERGAFTGAVARFRGKFELAHRGTLFLDEIGELSLAAQVRLLRVLEGQEFMRIGGEQPVRVDVRLLAATNADLESAVRSGRFREDLYFRLKVVTLDVPPLRSRTEDIADLVRLFADQICRTNNLPRHDLELEVLEIFGRYAWPGNVRELKNLLEGLIITSREPCIRVPDLPASVLAEPEEAAASFEPGMGMTLAEVECEVIRRTLESLQGNRTRAARLLNIGVRTLQRKIRRYGLQAVGRASVKRSNKKGERPTTPLPAAERNPVSTIARPSAGPFRQ